MFNNASAAIAILALAMWALSAWGARQGDEKIAIHGELSAAAATKVQAELTHPQALLEEKQRRIPVLKTAAFAATAMKYPAFGPGLARAMARTARNAIKHGPANIEHGRPSPFGDVVSRELGELAELLAESPILSQLIRDNDQVFDRVELLEGESAIGSQLIWDNDQAPEWMPAAIRDNARDPYLEWAKRLEGDSPIGSQLLRDNDQVADDGERAERLEGESTIGSPLIGNDQVADWIAWAMAAADKGYKDDVAALVGNEALRKAAQEAIAWATSDADKGYKDDVATLITQLSFTGFPQAAIAAAITLGEIGKDAEWKDDSPEMKALITAAKDGNKALRKAAREALIEILHSRAE